MLASLEQTLSPSPSDIQVGAQFGRSVAISDTFRVVGAPAEDVGGFQNSGQAYIFDATTGALIRTLNNPTPGANDRFGQAVAVSGNDVVVGASGNNSGSGGAYVFNALTGALTATLASHGGHFGESVAISGNITVVGASEENTGATAAGSAYIFNSTTGALLFTLHNPTPQFAEIFGHAVAVAGNTVVVGAPLAFTGGNTPGLAYVYNATTGNLTNTLAAPVSMNGEAFGWSVAVDGSVVVVGANSNSVSVPAAGAAYLYDLSSVTPNVALATLNAPTPIENGAFGESVSISGSTVLVGAVAGATQLFDAGTGNPITSLESPRSNDRFGGSVAIAGNKVLVGATGNANDTETGSAYVFDIHPGSIGATLSGGDLSLTDSDAVGTGNILRLSVDGENLVVESNEVFSVAPPSGTLSQNNKTLTLLLTNVTGSLTINGLAGNDELTLDFVAGDPVPAGGLIFNGGGNSSGLGDVLKIKGSGTQSANYTPSAQTAGSGAISIVGSGPIVFTGLEPVDISDLESLTLTTPGGNDNLELANGFDYRSGLIPAVRISGTSDNIAWESVAVWNTHFMIVDAGANDSVIPANADDTVNVTSAAFGAGGSGDSSQLFILTGTIGADIVNINGDILSGGLAINTGTINYNAISQNVGVTTLTARNSINDGNGSALNLRSSILNVTTGSGMSLDTASKDFNLAVTGTGDIAIRNVESSFAALRNVSTTNGDVFFSHTQGSVSEMRIGMVSAPWHNVTLMNLVGVGSMIDDNGAANNVTAASVKLMSSNGIGAAGDALETTVSNLAASAGFDGIYLANTGSLAITTVSGLNGVGAAGGAIVVTVPAGVVTVDGTFGADDFVLRNNGTNLQYTTAGGVPVQLPGLTALTFNGLAGDDRLTLDYMGGEAVPVEGLTFNGGSNLTAQGDKLYIKGKDGTQDVTYIPASAGSGSLLVKPNAGASAGDWRAIAFSGLEPIDVSDLAFFRVITPNGKDEIAVADGKSFFNPTVDALRISGSSGSVDFATVAAWNISNAPGGNPGFLAIEAGKNDGVHADDTVKIASASLALVGIVRFRVLTGANGTDTVTIAGALEGGDVLIDTGTINVNALIENSSSINLYARGLIVDGNGGGLNLVATSILTSAGAGIDLDINADFVRVALTGAGDILLRNRRGASRLVSVEVPAGDFVYDTLDDVRVDLVSVSGTATLLTASLTNDHFLSENLISASSLKLSATNGIGTAGDPLLTKISNLAAQGGTGGVYLNNSIGPLSITTVSGLNGVSATAGSIVVNVAGGSVRVEGSAGNDVYALSKNGPHFQYAPASSVPVQLPGLTSITFDGLAGDDRLTVDYVGGNPVPTGGVFYNGQTNSGSTSGDILKIAGTGVQVASYIPSATTSGSGAISVVGSALISFTGLEPLDLTGLAELSLSLTGANREIVVANGTSFFAPAVPSLQVSGISGGLQFETMAVWNTPTVRLSGSNIVGSDDRLTLDLQDLVNPNLSLTGLAAGTLITANRPAISFSEFERLRAVGVPLNGLDLGIDLLGIGLQDNLADAIDLSRNQVLGNFTVETRINGKLVVDLEEQALDSIRIVGSSDDETVSLTETVHGIVKLTGPSQGAKGVETGVDNPNAGGQPDIQFDGGGGNDTLSFAFTTGGTLYDQTYAIGDGAGGGASSGEVHTADGGFAQANSVYFTGLERIQTAAAGGELTFLGDTAANTINVLPGPAGFTRIAAQPNFVPLDFAASAFVALNVFGLGDSDTLDFQAVGAGENALTTVLLDGDNILGADSAADTIRVRTLPLGASATLLGGAGDDSFLLTDSPTTATSGTTAGILGAVTVSPGGGDETGTDTLIVDNSASASGSPVTVTKSTLNGFTGYGGIDISYANIDTLDVTADQGANTIDYDFLTIISGSDLDTVRLRGDGGADTFLPAPVVAGTVADPLTQISLLELFGGAGDDSFGNSSTAQRIRPDLGFAIGTQINIFGDAAGGDTLFLDMALANSPVIVNTTQGTAVAASHRQLDFGGIESISLYDGLGFGGSMLQPTQFGETYHRPLVISRLDVLENQQQAVVGDLSLPGAIAGNVFNYAVSDSRFEIVANTLRLKTNDSLALSAGATVSLSVTLRDVQNLEFTQSFNLNVVANPFPWHNPGLQLGEDANSNNVRDINDATFILGLMRARQGGTLPLPRPGGGHYGDVDADGKLDINDVLSVISFLRRRAHGGEGESVSPPPESAALTDVGHHLPESSVVWDLALTAISQEVDKKKKNVSTPPSSLNF